MAIKTEIYSEIGMAIRKDLSLEKQTLTDLMKEREKVIVREIN